MASWVISVSWTQCGQPHSTWPRCIAATSSCCGLGSSTTSESGEDLLAGGEARRPSRPGRRRARRTRSAYPCSRVIRARRSASRPGRCSGCSGSRCSFSLAEVPTTPRPSSVTSSSVSSLSEKVSVVALGALVGALLLDGLAGLLGHALPWRLVAHGGSLVGSLNGSVPATVRLPASSGPAGSLLPAMMERFSAFWPR